MRKVQIDAIFYLWQLKSHANICFIKMYVFRFSQLLNLIVLLRVDTHFSPFCVQDADLSVCAAANAKTNNKKCLVGMIVTDLNRRVASLTRFN